MNIVHQQDEDYWDLPHEKYIGIEPDPRPIKEPYRIQCIVYTATWSYQIFLPCIFTTYGILFMWFKVYENNGISENFKPAEIELWKDNFLYAPICYVMSKAITDPLVRMLIVKSTWTRAISCGGSFLSCAGLLFLWMGTENYGVIFYILSGICTGVGTALSLAVCECLYGLYFKSNLRIFYYLGQTVSQLGFIVAPVLLGHFIPLFSLFHIILCYMGIMLYLMIGSALMDKPTYLDIQDTEEDVFNINSTELKKWRQYERISTVDELKNSTETIDLDNPQPSCSGYQNLKQKTEVLVHQYDTDTDDGDVYENEEDVKWERLHDTKQQQSEEKHQTSNIQDEKTRNQTVQWEKFENDSNQLVDLQKSDRKNTISSWEKFEDNSEQLVTLEKVQTNKQITSWMTFDDELSPEMETKKAFSSNDLFEVDAQDINNNGKTVRDSNSLINLQDELAEVMLESKSKTDFPSETGMQNVILTSKQSVPINDPLSNIVIRLPKQNKHEIETDSDSSVASKESKTHWNHDPEPLFPPSIDNSYFDKNSPAHANIAFSINPPDSKINIRETLFSCSFIRDLTLIFTFKFICFTFYVIFPVYIAASRKATFESVSMYIAELATISLGCIVVAFIVRFKERLFFGVLTGLFCLGAACFLILIHLSPNTLIKFGYVLAFLVTYLSNWERVVIKQASRGDLKCQYLVISLITGFSFPIFFLIIEPRVETIINLNAILMSMSAVACALTEDSVFTICSRKDNYRN